MPNILQQLSSYMTLEYNFTGIRLIESVLTPVDWSIQVDLVATTSRTGKTITEVEALASFTYQKIYFWLDSNLPGMIAVNVKNEDDLYIANLSSNIMMYCPATPSDDTLIQLLHAKITSLTDDSLIIGTIVLKGSDTSIRYTFDTDNGIYSLPDTVAEYYSNGVSLHTSPWWHRDDGFCFEFIRPVDTDLTDEELFGEVVDPMTEFAKVMQDVVESKIAIVREPAKIVKVEKWQPKKV